MRIQHNIMAMNAYRNYNTNTSALSKNLEKLSSGYKINRAGDDAAGLAISEKMRAQITGLNAATKNVKDGISLVKTAEGAMQEIQDMLNRMDYLATQSANGTYDNEVDRLNLQKEVTALKDEINRIAKSANFNGIQLLDGSKDAASLGAATTELTGASTWAIGATAANPTQGTNTILHKDGKEEKATVFEVDLSDVAFNATSTAAAAATVTLTVGGQALMVGVAASAGISGASIAAGLDGKTVALNGATYTIAAEGTKLVFTMSDADAAKLTTAASFTGSYNVEIGCNDTTNRAQEGDSVFSSHAIQTGNPKTSATLADTTATLATADFADGAGVKIGNETYVFALTQETADKFANSAGVKVVNLVDLANSDGTGLDTGVTNVLEQACERLTLAAKDNDMFIVEHDGATVGKMNFREKVDYYDNEDHVDLSKADVIQAQFSKFTGVTINDPAKADGAPSALTLQIGDDSKDYNQLAVNIKSMKTAAMGIDGVDIGTQAGAQAAVDVIKNAINYVSGVRGDLGAVQNRLEHTQNNLSVMAENIQDAESTIRDTDVAEEMMSYVKNNILVQSAQAMLAQANQVPQGVLQLLG